MDLLIESLSQNSNEVSITLTWKCEVELKANRETFTTAWPTSIEHGFHLLPYDSHEVLLQRAAACWKSSLKEVSERQAQKRIRESNNTAGNHQFSPEMCVWCSVAVILDISQLSSSLFQTAERAKEKENKTKRNWILFEKKKTQRGEKKKKLVFGRRWRRKKTRKSNGETTLCYLMSFLDRCAKRRKRKHERKVFAGDGGSVFWWCHLS